MAQTNRVYLDNTMHFQLGGSEDNPEGEVVTLQQGWNEIPENLRNHPMIKRMIPESEAEVSRREQLIEAEKTRNEAIADAETAYREAVIEAEKERQEELQQRIEERAQRMEQNRASGVVAYEPNPDPEAQRAETLTLPPNMQVISAAGMAYKGSESVSAAQQRVMDSGVPASQTQSGASVDSPQAGTAPGSLTGAGTVSGPSPSLPSSGATPDTTRTVTGTGSAATPTSPAAGSGSVSSAGSVGSAGTVGTAGTVNTAGTVGSAGTVNNPGTTGGA
jgi:syndecan 1